MLGHVACVGETRNIQEILIRLELAKIKFT
jgi:hypothetical protein